MAPWHLQLLAVLANAGADTQTSGCVSVEGQLICPRERSNGETERIANDIWFRSEVRRARAEARDRDRARQEAAAAERSLKEVVGSLIADGKCSAAYDAALRAGDLSLASQVKEICSSTD